MKKWMRDYKNAEKMRRSGFSDHRKKDAGRETNLDSPFLSLPSSLFFFHFLSFFLPYDPLYVVK
jgi:hypothetical protein